MWLIRRTIRRLKRAIQYAIHGWSSEDWDSHHLLKDMEFKIGRLRDDLEAGIVDLTEDNGKIAHKSIKLAQRILKKLTTSNYDHFLSLTESTTGDIKFVSLPNGNSTLRYENETDDNSEKLRKLVRHAYDLDEAQRQRDTRNLFRLLEKYYGYWWT